MGRGIETAMLNHVKRLCFERFERASVSAAYVPSGRNMPVSELYERQGFTVVERGEDGCKHYRLERSDQRACECDHIALEEG
jgi:predicted enzyme involved in methoxymalonyl-ACP biosynthesis